MTLKEWYIRIKNKLIYSIGVHFPYSKVRVRSLRALGWRVGKNVYFPADLVITQNFVYYRGELEKAIMHGWEQDVSCYLALL